MQTYTPKIYNLPNPAGFDLEIGIIQAKLAQITWIDTIFGRANIAKRQITQEQAKNQLTPINGITGRELYYIYYPQGRKLDSDIDLTISDAYPNMCYFYTHDTINVNIKAEEWGYPDNVVQVQQPFSLIFWCNLIKMGDKSDGNYLEKIKLTLLSVLSDCPRVMVGNLYEGMDNVFKDFSITNMLANYTKYPYYALRIEAKCVYPAFPENGNNAFDPSIYIDKTRATTQPNINTGQPNTN